MVYRGRPSRGCENCRKVHKKCDEKKPECSRCVKMQKPCSGYRDLSTLMFCDETSKTQQKIQRQHMPIQGSQQMLSPNVTFTVIPTQESSFTRKISKIPAYSISPSLQDFAIYHFYHANLNNLSDQDPVYHLHTLLPALYAQSRSGSALSLATEAISYASSSKLVPEATQLSRKRYGKAIKALKVALQDPVEVSSDQTLYAILLLSGYETTVWDSNEPPAWGAHVDGAAAVMKLRTKNKLHTSVSRSLFFFIKKSVVLSHMQISQPVDKTFTELDATTFWHGSLEDELIAIAAAIPQLQHTGIKLFTQPQSTNKIDIEEFMFFARTLDCELSDWATEAMNSWSYSAATNANRGAGPEYSPCEIHRYLDFYIARVWNFYRVSRLIILSLLIRATSWWSHVLSETPRDGFDVTKFETLSLHLVDEICASVPFLMGKDLSKMKLPATNRRDKENYSEFTKSGMPENTRLLGIGSFSLLWPLHVACSASSVPTVQREWMRTQLQVIAERGEPRAHSVRATESQTLLGAAENFQFDCV
ncbi:C6 zinc finger protein [Dactylonectria estremocensis]|uniref:C6 zinc finger protein n=1 Tax=Dactylonectria estremocensis TaxID=1079267 RepID=A0A9P9IQY3_9HYPO|nr:C6 zinc finger protein [Dactylonectria estremocensis]